MIVRYLTYTILLITISTSGYCQDIIIKKDSSKIEAMIYKIEAKEIVYSIYYSAKETIFRIPKKDVSKVTFRNGTEILFDTITNAKSKYDVIVYVEKKRKERPKRKPDTLEINDYIKFNIQVGTVVNDANCNRQYDNHQAPTKFSGEEYSRNNQPNYTNCSINIGCNFLLGASPYIKHIVGIHYLRSKGEFTYEKYGMSINGNYVTSSYYKEINYKTKVDFINVISGLRFRTLKNFYIEPLLGINIPVYASNILNGTETSKSYGVITEQKIYKDVKSSELPESLFTVSICPRLSYEFKIKQQTFGVYFSYNLSYRINVPWFMAGITYYPFKKLR